MAHVRRAAIPPLQFPVCKDCGAPDEMRIGNTVSNSRQIQNDGGTTTPVFLVCGKCGARRKAAVEMRLVVS
jgi:hypothetical protein